MTDDLNHQPPCASESNSTTAPNPLSDVLPWIDGLAARDLPTTRIHAPEHFEVRDLRGEYPLRWMPRPESEVDSSWLRQVTVIDDAGIRIRIQARLDEAALGGVAGDQFTDRPVPDWPLAEPLLILGAVRGPAVMYSDEAAASQAELIRQLHLYNVAARPATTVDRSHKWTEPSVIAHPDPDDSRDDWLDPVLDIALQMGIETVVQMAHGLWTVLTRTRTPPHRFTVTTRVPASITQDGERRCPMQTAPAQGAYCRMRGGPWTSSSIAAAAGWRDQRDLLVAALGCDTCEGKRYLFQGQVVEVGGPTAIVPSPMPTRWLRADDKALRQPNAHG